MNLKQKTGLAPVATRGGAPYGRHADSHPHRPYGNRFTPRHSGDIVVATLFYFMSFDCGPHIIFETNVWPVTTLAHPYPIIRLIGSHVGVCFPVASGHIAHARGAAAAEIPCAAASRPRSSRHWALGSFGAAYSVACRTNACCRRKVRRGVVQAVLK